MKIPDKTSQTDTPPQSNANTLDYQPSLNQTLVRSDRQRNINVRRRQTNKDYRQTERNSRRPKKKEQDWKRMNNNEQ
jgi:hypothetical protein